MEGRRAPPGHSLTGCHQPLLSITIHLVVRGLSAQLQRRWARSKPRDKQPAAACQRCYILPSQG